jgi:predicted Rossmann fold nucleotide-binding protein DprA/Smf involved in DNA uptake
MSAAPSPVWLSPESAEYPARLRARLSERAPASIAALGNLVLLNGRLLALFCSVRCPGSLILRTCDLAAALRNVGVPVISGFHSPVEQECLTLLLRGTQPVVICLPRSIEGTRLPPAWREPLEQGRMLLLSPFAVSQRRATEESAQTRNLLAAALADALLIAHATPGGKTERFAAEARGWGAPLLTLASEANAGLVALGARVISPDTPICAWWPPPENLPNLAQ